MAADGVSDASPPGGRAILGLLALSAVVGLVVSLGAWCFLELTHQIQVGVYDKLPGDLGFDGGAPTWWPLPVLALAGLIVAFAIVRLPGEGGHNPAEGLKMGATQPLDLPGVMLAAIATVGLGAVLGPEAPLIALGTGLGILAVRRIRTAGAPVVEVVAAAGSFAAIAFIFGSPLIGAILLLEAAGLDRQKLQIVLPTGLLAAGIGSLVSIGLGQWTGLSTKDYALQTLTLPSFARPDVVDFLWTIPLAAAIAVGCMAIFTLARAVQPAVMRRAFVLIPVAGLVIAGLAIAFAQATDKDASEVLFSGQDALPGLVNGAGTWSVSALVLLLSFKGLAWSVSLAGFRGGPTFPGLYMGAAAGILASHLPGFPITPAVAVGMGAAVVAVLRLPLSAVVMATLLTSQSGVGAGPLIIVGVVTASFVAVALDRRRDPEPPSPPPGSAVPA